MALIEIVNLRREFRTERGDRVEALSSVNLTISDREVLMVVGPSGCGKTTMLRLIAGLDHPTSGTISVDGEPVRGPGRDRGLVFQSDAIFLWRTVRKNVEYGLEIQGLSPTDRRRIADHHLQMVGLEKFADLYPKELSGGMKKRCQLATVLANDPEVLLMDEPFGALDYPTKSRLQEELLRILESTPKTTCFVTHDIEEALFLGDRVVLMAQGSIETIVDVPFERPRDEALRVRSDFSEMKADLWRLMRDSTGTRDYL